MNPTVMHHGVQRKAKGFSWKEVEESGIECSQICALGLRFDCRRSTSYKENVSILKEAAKNVPKAAPEPNTPARK